MPVEIIALAAITAAASVLTALLVLLAYDIAKTHRRLTRGSLERRAKHDYAELNREAEAAEAAMLEEALRRQTGRRRDSD